MRIQVACVAADNELLLTLEIADGATVADALRIADVARRIGAVPDPGSLAIFGQRVDGTTPLRDGDRIEITRPLLCDPKAARRNRADRTTAGAAVGRPHARRRRRSAI
jgi:putative ubiquitin-RnfH superfamily antitoxin RatB of RatAB toxin-antitoxin module